jgi:Galactose oxidase, central domain
MSKKGNTQKRNNSMAHNQSQNPEKEIGQVPNMNLNISSVPNLQTEAPISKDKIDKNITKVDCLGKNPSSRFGHTMVLVSQMKAVLFGGAVGDTKNFNISNETYVLNMMTKIWTKLECINN